MKMPINILERLLKGEHFNVEQRKSLGLWPSETLSYNEVMSHLTNVLEHQEWFPFEWRSEDGKSRQYEGIVIHHCAPDRYLCYAQRSLADDPNVIAETSQIEFSSSKEAAEYFLKWELHLPGILDGWRVE